MPVARTGTAMCPVGMMEQYYEMGEIGHNSDLPLFRAITTTKCGQRLRASGSLSYTRMREIFLGKLSGATAAANAGVADRLFKRHG